MVVKRNDLGAIDFHYTENGKTTTYSKTKSCISRVLLLMGLLVYLLFSFAQTIGMQFDANNQAQDWFKNGLKVGASLKLGSKL